MFHNSVSALKTSVLPRHNIQHADATHKYVKTKYKHYSNYYDLQQIETRPKN
jgi:hypothetical protein